MVNENFINLWPVTLIEKGEKIVSVILLHGKEIQTYEKDVK